MKKQKRINQIGHDIVWQILIIVITSFIPFQSISAENRPVIVLIMADDMGISDIGCYGSEIETPNIDYLAANGLKFTQFYNSARCCPSRISLMTGLHSHQTGFGYMVNDLGHDSYRGDLNNRSITIAEALKIVG